MKFDSLFNLKNFRLIQPEINTKVFLTEWRSIAEYGQPGRAQAIHRESMHYLLRWVRRNRFNKNFFIGNIIKTEERDNYKKVPEITKWLENFSEKHDGKIGRAYIAVLPSGGRVYRHCDRGAYFALRDRYHLVIQSEGTCIVSGSQKNTCMTGEVWWFNNKVPHEVFNNGKSDRIHLIFDLLPNSFILRMKNLLLWGYFTVGRKIGLPGLKI